MNAKEVVIAYWRAMQTNDFHHASELLSENYECYWPQSSELIRGRENFAAINSYYPANGTWQFDILSIVEEGKQVVTEVAITDGTVHAVALTFHTVEDGLITYQKEYWPDNYPAPEWRRQWVTMLNNKDNKK